MIGVANMTEDKFELYERISKENTEFKKLFDEHIRFEQDLEALYSLKYFPPEVETKIKEIKRRKLLGKDSFTCHTAERIIF